MGTRLLARLIDVVILLVPCILIAQALGPSRAELDAGQDLVSLMGKYTAANAATTLLALAYEVILIAVRGATLGKQLMKIKVVREHDGQLPGFGPSLLRWLVPTAAGAVTCGLGGVLVYLSPLFDKSGRLQGWHDKVAKTLVVRAR